MKSLNPRNRFCHWLLATFVFALPMFMTSAVRADDEYPEARLEGYTPPVRLVEPGGIGGAIFFSILVMGIAGGVMFMNANRSHLD